MSGYSGKDGKYYDTHDEMHTADQNWDIAHGASGDSNNSPPPKSNTPPGKSVKARILKELWDMVGIIFKQ